MTAPLLLAMLALAAYRLTRLVTVDSLFDRPREAWLDRYPPDGERAKVRVDWDRWDERPPGGAYMTPRAEPPKVSHLGAFATCPFCVGVWVSAALVGAVWALFSVPMPALWFAAVSGAQALLSAVDSKLSG